MPNAAAKKILVVDDDKTIVKTIEFKLQSEGYKVVTAFDGEDGLCKARTEKPDLIILDLLMPKMDGVQVEKTLRSYDGTKNVPVIFLTKTIDKKSAEVMDNKFANFIILAKPFNAEELLAVIRKALK